jgi:hypothetical protein
MIGEKKIKIIEMGDSLVLLRSVQSGADRQ